MSTITTESTMAAISNPLKTSVMGWPIATERKTSTGATKRAICVLAPVAMDGQFKDCGHDQRGHGNHQHGAIHGRGGLGKTLEVASGASHHHAQSQHQKKVANDAAGKRRFDHADVPGAQSKNCDDQLRS